MRHAGAVGASALLTIVVTDDMTACFEGEQVHPVYGTAALVGHAEQVSRRLLVGRLEAGEEGVGAHIEVDQLAPVPVGGQVDLTATVVDAAPRRMTTEVDVRHGGRIVARVRFVQVVVDLDTWWRDAGLGVG